MTQETAGLLFAIEAAIPFVESAVGTRTCSSAGGPLALKAMLDRYDWENERWKWVLPSKSVLPGMNTETVRQSENIEQVKQEIQDVFVFNAPMSMEHLISCEKIQNACKALAQAIADEVPEGKERTIAINNLLSTALFARHGITRRQIHIGATEKPLPPIPVPPQPSPRPSGAI